MHSFTFSLLLALAMVCVCTAVVRPAEKFDANEDAWLINLSLTHSQFDKIMKLLPRRSSAQRVAIAKAYQAKYKVDLVSDFEKYLSGDFKDLVTIMVTPPGEYFAKELYLDGSFFTYSTGAVVDILLTVSNALIHEINDAYVRLKFNTHIKLVALLTYFSHSFGLTSDMIYAALDGRRSESQEVNEASIKTDAELINRMGLRTNPHRRGFTDDRRVQAIFSLSSPTYLRKLFSEYEKIYGHPIETAFVDRGWAGIFERGVLNIINVYRSAPKYFAERLYYSMKGIGTDDRSLMRIIVMRSEIDLDKIKDTFWKMYNIHLADMVADDTDGDYQGTLLLMINL